MKDREERHTEEKVACEGRDRDWSDVDTASEHSHQSPQEPGLDSV
jgi:hypothetical protein